MRVGATLGAALSACLACGGESLTEFDCSLDGRKAFVAEIMTDFYLWYDLVPEPDYASAESPQDLLRQMSFREVDHWSGMQQIVERREYFDQGRFQGLGYSLGRDREGGLRISWVHEGSSAGRAGLDRGALLRRVNGLEVADLSPGDLGAELAQDMVVHTVEELDGTVHDVELSQDDVQITSVKSPTVIDAPGGKVGYFMFTTFVLPGEQELRDVFVRDITGYDHTVDLHLVRCIDSDFGHLREVPGMTEEKRDAAAATLGKRFAPVAFLGGGFYHICRPAGVEGPQISVFEPP
jgi:hypothetical protein